MVANENGEHRHKLHVKRAQRGGADRNRLAHRQVLHHRRSWPVRSHHRAQRFDVRHKDEDPRHHVKQKITAYRQPAQPQHIEQEIERGHHDEGLKYVDDDRQKGIAVRRAGRANGVVKRQIQKGKRAVKQRCPALGLKHAPLPVCARSMSSGLVVPPNASISLHRRQSKDEGAKYGGISPGRFGCNIPAARHRGRSGHNGGLRTRGFRHSRQVGRKPGHRGR